MGLFTLHTHLVQTVLDQMTAGLAKDKMTSDMLAKVGMKKVMYSLMVVWLTRCTWVPGTHHISAKKYPSTYKIRY